VVAPEVHDLLLTLPHILWHIGPIFGSRRLKATGLCSAPGPLLKERWSGPWSVMEEGKDVYQ
jgi:hypothetical protein